MWPSASMTGWPASRRTSALLRVTAVASRRRPAGARAQAPPVAAGLWAGSAAVGTHADQVEAVLDDVEVVLVRGRSRRLGQRPLEAGRRPDVGHLAARAAHEVVVVAGEVLGELEPPVVVGAGHPPGSARVQQHGDVAVRARLREARVGLEDLGDGEGATGAGERLDEGTAQPGVALVATEQAEPDLLVDARLHRLSAPRRRPQLAREHGTQGQFGTGAGSGARCGRSSAPVPTTRAAA